MTTLIEIVPGPSGYFRAGDFDTRKRYLRHGTASDRFPIVKDLTFKVQTNSGGPAWRWSNGVDSYHYEETGSPIAYDPAHTLVNL